MIEASHTAVRLHTWKSGAGIQSVSTGLRGGESAMSWKEEAKGNQVLGLKGIDLPRGSREGGCVQL